jgi:hypothetical protein
MIRKDVITAVLITFCLTVTLFLTIPSHSNPNAYDPWADLNDDGTIDIYDAIQLANTFGSSGEPIIKSQIALPSFTSKPAWDSGWQEIGIGMTQFDHNLNTTELLVYMISKDNTGQIHQFGYGSLTSGISWGNLTATRIILYRGLGDESSNLLWNQTRILMWKIP